MSDESLVSSSRKLVSRYGLLEVPDSADDVIGRFLARYGEWAWLEAAFVASTLPDEASILDAGAFAGTFGLGVAKAKALKRAVFVEANPSVAEILRHNVAANLACPSLVIQSMVAGPHARSGISQEVSGNLGGTTFSASDDPDAPGAVPALTLARLRSDHGPFDLIKLDIEGMEHEALLGDAAFLATGQTALWVEANEDPRTLKLAGLLLSWGVPVYYFAFPSYNPKNFYGAWEPIFPFAYEAGLLAAPKCPPSLSAELREAGCVLRPVSSVADVKDALWRTPRWGMTEWLGATDVPELAALVGHSILGVSSATFLSEGAAPPVTLWQRLDAEQAARQELQARLGETEAARQELQARLGETEAAKAIAEKYAIERLAKLEGASQRIALLDQELSELSAQMDAAWLREEEMEKALRAAEGESAARGQRIAQLDTGLADSEAQRAELRDAVEAGQRRLAQITSELRDAQRDLNIIYHSTLWRVGRPAIAFVRRHSGLHALLRKARAVAGRIVRGIRRRPVARVASAPARAIATESVPSVAPDPRVSLSEREAVAPYFDAPRYLAANPEVTKLGIDPLDHFLLRGWREDRSPGPAFDMAYYLESNPDVLAAGINPLLHYVWAGKAEGRRATRPMDTERRVLESATSPRVRAADWGGAADHRNPMSRADLVAALARGGQAPIIVSVSHDDYAANFGGIQNVVGDEQLAFAARGWRYLHLSPAAPLPILADRQGDEDYRLRLRLDGAAVGVARFRDLAEALVACHRQGTEISFVFHHLAGHVPELLATLPGLTGGKAVAWAHDFFAMCPSFNLMRNDVKFCGAPPVNASGCSVCAIGRDRPEHVERMRAFFTTVRPFILAPSAIALEVWRAGKLPHSGSAVVPPARLTAAGDADAYTEDRPLRVAHLGGVALFKGWDVFERLAFAYAGDARYEFVHLGLGSQPSSRYRQDPVRVDAEHPDAMIDAVRRNRIDVAIIWSLWPETFCFTAHEALAGGAFVVARRAGGNIWPAVEANAPGQGCAIDDEESLFRMFNTGEIRTLVAGAKRQRFALTRGGNSAEYISATRVADEAGA